MVASFLSLFPLLPQLFVPTPTASHRDRPCKHFFLASTQSPINTAIGRIFWSGGAPMLRGQFSSLKGQIQRAGRGKRHQLAVVVAGHRQKRRVPQLRAHLPHCRVAQQGWSRLWLDAQQLLEDEAVARRFASKTVQTVLHSSQGQLVMLRERDTIGTVLLTLVSAWQPGCQPHTTYQH